MKQQFFKALGIYLAFPILLIAGESNAELVPEVMQAAIYLKVMEYDQSIAASSQKNITIHLLFDAKTEKQKSALVSGFNTISGKSVFGKKVTVAISTQASLATAVSSGGIHFLYLPAGSADKTIADSVAFGLTNHIPVWGGDESVPGKGGAVGLSVVNKKPTIVVHLKNATAMGMKLNSNFLNLVSVI